jgi:hypothetical protein
MSKTRKGKMKLLDDNIKRRKDFELRNKFFRGINLVYS